MSVALASDLAHREALLTRVVALVEDEAIDDISMASRSRYILGMSTRGQSTADSRNGPTIPIGDLALLDDPTGGAVTPKCFIFSRGGGVWYS